jgi:hypothetical protein
VRCGARGHTHVHFFLFCGFLFFRDFFPFKQFN